MKNSIVKCHIQLEPNLYVKKIKPNVATMKGRLKIVGAPYPNKQIFHAEVKINLYPYDVLFRAAQSHFCFYHMPIKTMR